MTPAEFPPLPAGTSIAPWACAVLVYGVDHQLLATRLPSRRQSERTATLPLRHFAVIDRGGCYTCRWFGARIDVAVWCARPDHPHHRSQAHLGRGFWQRDPGSDDE